MTSAPGRDFVLALAAVVGLTAPFVALSSCGAKREASAEVAMIDRPAAPEIVAWISVPMDPAARYRALSVERKDNGLVEINTLREVADRRRYTSHLVDCRRELIATARDAATEETFNTQTPGLGTMAPWLPGTPGEKIARYACAIAGG